MDPEQTAPIKQSDLGPHCLPMRLVKHFSRQEKQTTFVAIGALRVKTCDYTLLFGVLGVLISTYDIWVCKYHHMILVQGQVNGQNVLVQRNIYLPHFPVILLKNSMVKGFGSHNMTINVTKFSS